MEDDNLSMLDLLFCAFGGVLILFVLLSTIIGSRAREETNPYLWLQASTDDPSKLPELTLGSLEDGTDCVVEFGEGRLQGWAKDGCSPAFIDSPDDQVALTGEAGAPKWGQVRLRFDPQGVEVGLLSVFVPTLRSGRYELRLFCRGACAYSDTEIELYLQYPTRKSAGWQREKLRIPAGGGAVSKRFEIDV